MMNGEPLFACNITGYVRAEKCSRHTETPTGHLPSTGQAATTERNCLSLNMCQTLRTD